MKLINADCIEAMKEMPDNSVDSIVTDPPYELGFMGKSWDSTGIAFNVEVWQEALRVLKPGGHLIAFSGSRTYHRMAVAIEDAGFEIRDQIMWVYGSGFPKSHSIDKAIDKAAGAEREVVATGFAYGLSKGQKDAGYRPEDYESKQLANKAITAEAKKWQGWGTALKPAHEPMVLARKPVIGTVASNVLTWGVGGLNIDESRVEGKLEGDSNRFDKTDGGWAIAKLHNAPVVRNEGRWPANFIHDGSWEVLELFPDSKSPGTYTRSTKATGNINWNPKNADSEQLGFNDSGTAARFFYCAKTSKRDRNEGLDGFEAKANAGSYEFRVDGSLDGKPSEPRANHHPTVKPTDLMRYLVKLVTPPNGTVLDPFMGSGSTGKGAVIEGFDFIGIEMNAEYLEIAKARIAYVQR